MRRLRLFSLTALALVLMAAGCSSIHSRSVRSLIEIETERVSMAKKASDELVRATDESIKNWRASVAALDRGLQSQRAIAGAHSLIFSSNQNVVGKTGVDAHAASYLVGEIYLADRMGFEQAILDQFEEDYKTLRALAKSIRQSWTGLEKTQSEIADFSQRSFLASVDADLARALIVESEGKPEAVEEVLKRSREINAAFNRTSLPGLSGPAAARLRTLTEDVLDLLDRVKK